MDSKTKKIAWACFIGGVLFGITAFCVAPKFWWLGMLAGLPGGYLGYEFRGVLRVVPEALLAAKAGLPKAIISHKKTLAAFFKRITRYCRRPQPLGFLAAIFMFLILLPAFKSGGLVISFDNFFTELCVFLMVITHVWFAFSVLLYFLARLGASKEKCYFRSIFASEMDYCYCRDINGFKEKTLTNSNAFRWLLKGAGRVAHFFFWYLWKGLLIGIWYLCKGLLIGIRWIFIFIWRFLKSLFILVHSYERVLCAIDGTLGATAAFLWLAPTAETLAAKAGVVVFGGFIGAGLGVVNYELVSKRWLRLIPQE